MGKHKTKPGWNASAWVVPDLTSMLKELAEEYFPWCKALPIIVWAFPKRVVTSAVNYGWYAPCQKFIYISLTLSQPWIPKEVLRYIVYHELCHFMQDVVPIKGEKVHSKRFMEWEAWYPETPASCAWLQAHIDEYMAEQNRLVTHSKG